MKNADAELEFQDIERVMNNRMRVLNALQPGELYTTDEVAIRVALPVTVVRRALNALFRHGLIAKTHSCEDKNCHGVEKDIYPHWRRNG